MRFTFSKLSDSYDKKHRARNIESLEELLRLSRRLKADLIVGYEYDLKGHPTSKRPHITVYDDYAD
jgi:uncharacterized protein YbjQ (UPF0145 family)